MTNLRREIHSAYDVITPPLGGMPERVVQTVLADKKRRRKEEMAVRFRMPLTLVAVLLLVAVIAAGVITWNSLHSNVSPVGGVHLTTLQQLEARPFRLQVFKSALDCTSGPYDTAGSFGSGPIFADGGSAVRTNWGEYWYNVVSADTAINGPVLVRVHDVYKQNEPAVFIGPFAVGPIVGTDVVNGNLYEQRAELVVNEKQVDYTTRPGWPTERHRFVWDFLVGIPSTASGGTGWQIDGPDFSEIFYAC